MKVRDVLTALREDNAPASGWVQPDGRTEAWIAGGPCWVRANGQHVTGHFEGRHFALYPRFLGAWRIRRAVRAWARRRHCHLEGHDVATFQRKGTRRSASWSYVAEDVTQTRHQCRHCGAAMTAWTDGRVRGWTSYSAPSDLYERVMDGGGDWSEPREVEASATLGADND